jgi:hypothetical protein
MAGGTVPASFRALAAGMKAAPAALNQRYDLESITPASD